MDDDIINSGKGIERNYTIINTRKYNELISFINKYDNEDRKELLESLTPIKVPDTHKRIIKEIEIPKEYLTSLRPSDQYSEIIEEENISNSEDNILKLETENIEAILILRYKNDKLRYDNRVDKEKYILIKQIIQRLIDIIYSEDIR